MLCSFLCSTCTTNRLTWTTRGRLSVRHVKVKQHTLVLFGGLLCFCVHPNWYAKLLCIYQLSTRSAQGTVLCLFFLWYVCCLALSFSHTHSRWWHIILINIFIKVWHATALHDPTTTTREFISLTRIRLSHLKIVQRFIFPLFNLNFIPHSLSFLRFWIIIHSFALSVIVLFVISVSVCCRAHLSSTTYQLHNCDMLIVCVKCTINTGRPTWDDQLKENCIDNLCVFIAVNRFVRLKETQIKWQRNELKD